MLFTPEMFDLTQINAAIAQQEAGYGWYADCHGEARGLLPPDMQSDPYFMPASGDEPLARDAYRWVPDYTGSLDAIWALITTPPAKRVWQPFVKASGAQASRTAGAPDDAGWVSDRVQLELRTDRTVVCRMRLLPGLPWYTVHATTAPLALSLALLSVVDPDAANRFRIRSVGAPAAEV